MRDEELRDVGVLTGARIVGVRSYSDGPIGQMYAVTELTIQVLNDGSFGVNRHALNGILQNCYGASK